MKKSNIQLMIKNKSDEEVQIMLDELINDHNDQTNQMKDGDLLNKN